MRAFRKGNRLLYCTHSLPLVQPSQAAPDAVRSLVFVAGANGIRKNLAINDIVVVVETVNMWTTVPWEACASLCGLSGALTP